MDEVISTGLNLNRARSDKYYMLLSRVPSSQLLIPDEQDILKQDMHTQNDMEFIRLALQSVELPGFGTGEIKLPTQLGPATSHTTNMHDFDSLTTTFRMDENYTLYKIFWLWIMLMNDPENVNQFNASKQADVTQVDGYVFVKNNFGKDVLAFRFFDLRPMTLPGLSLNFADEGTEIDFPVTWMYSYFIPVYPNLQSYDIFLKDA